MFTILLKIEWTGQIILFSRHQVVNMIHMDTFYILSIFLGQNENIEEKNLFSLIILLNKSTYRYNI